MEVCFSPIDGYRAVDASKPRSNVDITGRIHDEGLDVLPRMTWQWSCPVFADTLAINSQSDSEVGGRYRRGVANQELHFLHVHVSATSTGSLPHCLPVQARDDAFNCVSIGSDVRRHSRTA